MTFVFVILCAIVALIAYRWLDTAQREKDLAWLKQVEGMAEVTDLRIAAQEKVLAARTWFFDKIIAKVRSWL